MANRQSLSAVDRDVGTPLRADMIDTIVHVRPGVDGRWDDHADVPTAVVFVVASG